MQKLISESEEHVHIGQITSLKHGGMEVAHFFNDEASNTFILYRTTTQIQLSIHGRNEIPNTGSGRIRKKFAILFLQFSRLLALVKFSGNRWHMDCYISNKI